MARFIRLTVVSVVVVVLVSADAAFGAARGAQSLITLTIGPARLLSPGFGYAVAYRTVRHGATAHTAIGLFVYDEGRWPNITAPMLREDGIDAIDDVAFVRRRDGWVAAYNCANASVLPVPHERRRPLVAVVGQAGVAQLRRRADLSELRR